jgi:hypothetical protein
VDSYSVDNPKTPFFTLHFPRGNTTNGTIGFGTVDPQFADVTKQPFQEAQDDIWRMHLDMDLGIIVNGRNISLPVGVVKNSENAITAAIDTGFAYSSIRTSVVHFKVRPPLLTRPL